MHNPYAVGKSIYLRHPLPEDVEGRWHEWFSDDDTTKYLSDVYWPNSKENQHAFYESFTKDKGRLVLSAVDKETDTHFGVCNLSMINWVHRYCSLSIVIGESDYRTGPCAFEVGALLLQVAFLRLNMRCVQAQYVVANEVVAKVLQVLRFEKTGETKGLYWIDGEYHDSISCAVYRDDWLKRNSPAR